MQSAGAYLIRPSFITCLKENSFENVGVRKLPPPAPALGGPPPPPPVPETETPLEPADDGRSSKREEEAARPWKREKGNME